MMDQKKKQQEQVNELVAALGGFGKVEDRRRKKGGQDNGQE